MADVPRCDSCGAPAKGSSCSYCGSGFKKQSTGRRKKTPAVGRYYSDKTSSPDYAADQFVVRVVIGICLAVIWTAALSNLLEPLEEPVAEVWQPALPPGDTMTFHLWVDWLVWDSMPGWRIPQDSVYQVEEVLWDTWDQWDHR